MRGWNDLGVVETIYEDEREDASTSPSSAPSPSSSSLQTRVDEWSRATGCNADVSVRVQNQCFLLHKERLASRSGYLRRMTESAAVVVVSPPLPVAAETFAAAAEFCYGGDVVLSPSNVVQMRVAAGLLEMAEMAETAEEYFSRAVRPFAESAAVALPHGLGLLGAGGGPMASRCVETLCAAGGGARLRAVCALSAADFRLLAASLRELHPRCHDLLFRVVDQYLEGGKLTEEEKGRIWGEVDSRKLTAGELARLVRNHRVPLRLVVQAMAAEQQRARRVVLGGATTLGGILRRDAALRQEAHLKAAMRATGNRIRALERELAEMKTQLRMSSLEIAPPRSFSCRFFAPEEKTPARKTLVQGLRDAFGKTKTGSETHIASSPEDYPPPRHRRHRSFA
ncbi:phototropic-responsive NPH3 family protein [Wolffia australiana]